MGLGKPIVASDLEQIGEVIEHERTGLLCPPGDADAAAQARRCGCSATTPCASGSARPPSRTRESRYSWDAHVAAHPGRRAVS